jgi:ribosomal protein L7/L12
MMLFAVLEFGDYAIIAVILLLAGGGAAASAYLRPADRERRQRIEHKLDLILTHLGIEYVPPPKAVWQELADDPARKIEAIKVYREQTGVGLAAAKKAVEDYIEGRSK